MPGMSAAPAARSQAGTSRGSTMSGTGSASGMDHSTMPMGGQAMSGMQQAPDPGAAKLQQLVAKLVEEPEVRQRILADTALRKGWQNPAVRQAVRRQP